MESDVKGLGSECRKRSAVSSKLLMSCHTSELGGAGVIESIAVFGLLKRPLSAAALLARRLLLSTLALEALELLLLSSTIGSLMLY